MLRNLYIQNYAIIRELEISFEPGFSTLTGETGAGKSILLGAFSLILGQRADTSVLLNKDLKSVVEGRFDHQPGELLSLLSENDIDIQEDLILRREISPNGKSRSFINDTPVNLNLMRDVGILLVDIHSQHENLSLNNQVYQLSVVDAFAGQTSVASEYRKEFSGYQQLRRELAELKENESRNRQEQEFLEFQVKELTEARLREGEQEELEEELRALSHIGEIKSGLNQVYENLGNAEVNALLLLRDSLQVLSKLAAYHRPSIELQKRLEVVYIELKDLAPETGTLAENLHIDPERLSIIEERLNLLLRLLQKHRAGAIGELIALRESMESKLKALADSDFRIGELEQKIQEKFNILKAKANALSTARNKAIPNIEKEVINLLVQLGIPSARFNIENTVSEIPGEYGIDQIRFLFTANKKTEVQEISRIASGGEISRLMLSIKSVISGSLGLPTIIFDEIDTGVSGEIAHRVGKIMKDMSHHRQVITITHLPQVASRGDRQFRVYKTENDSGSSTGITLLDHEDRLTEIARMLSGEQTTAAALANARELLKEV